MKMVSACSSKLGWQLVVEIVNTEREILQSATSSGTCVKNANLMRMAEQHEVLAASDFLDASIGGDGS
jgi:hypothetical protein